MTHRETALAFIERFCAADVDGLTDLLAEDLQFQGPLFQGDTRDAYLDSLRTAPPEPCEFEILSITENDDAVCIWYDYRKPDMTITIAQRCQFQDARIAELHLLFDASPFR